MAFTWMKFCLTVVFIIFAKCAITGVGYPVADKAAQGLPEEWKREIICELPYSGSTQDSGCDIKVLTTFQSKLGELTQEVEILVNEEKAKGFGFYDLQELTTVMSRLTELIQEVERLMNVDEEGSTIGSGSGLFQGEKEEGSAAPCNPQVLAAIRLRLNEFIREVKRLANAPKPTVDPTTEPLIDQVCPHGWVHHGHSCFHIIDTPTLKWRNARTMCRQLGGDLGKITTSSENQFIYDFLRKQTTVTHYGVWIGLHRKADSQFYWVDDTPLMDYTAWGSGEPNNSPGHGGENCVHKIGDKRNWPFNAGEWNDVPCDLSGIVPSEIAPVVLCQKRIDTGVLSF